MDVDVDVDAGNASSSSSTTTCAVACFADWSNVGDFALDAASPMCDLHTPTLRVLWALLAVVELSSLAFAAWALLARWQRGMLRRAQWRTWGVAVLLGCAAVAILPLAVGKANDPTAWVVGRDVGATLSYSISAALAWGMIMLSFSVFVNTTVALGTAATSSAVSQGSVPMDIVSVARALRFATPLLALANTVWCVTPMFLLGDASLVWVVAGLHSMGLAFSMLVGVVASPALLGTMRRHVLSTVSGLKASSAESTQAQAAPVVAPPSTTARLELIERKFRATQRAVFLSGVFQFAVAFVFGLWPFFVRKLSYQFPFAWITACQIGVLVVWSTTTTRGSVLVWRRFGGVDGANVNVNAAGQAQGAGSIFAASTWRGRRTLAPAAPTGVVGVAAAASPSS